MKNVRCWTNSTDWKKLRYIQNAKAWQNIRYPHLDYPDDGGNVPLINMSCEAAEGMYNLLKRIEEKLKIDQPTLELGRSMVYPQQSFRWAV